VEPTYDVTRLARDKKKPGSDGSQGGIGHLSLPGAIGSKAARKDFAGTHDGVVRLLLAGEYFVDQVLAN